MRGVSAANISFRLVLPNIILISFLAIAELSSATAPPPHTRENVGRWLVDRIKINASNGESKSNIRGVAKRGLEAKRRKLSVWSSFLNMLHCPPGFDHTNNPHCNHHHHKSHGGSNHSHSGGSSGNTSSTNDDGSTSATNDDDGSTSTTNDDDGSHPDDDLNQDPLTDDIVVTDDVNRDDDDDGSDPWTDDDMGQDPSTDDIAVTDDDKSDDFISNDLENWWEPKSSTSVSNSSTGTDGSNNASFVGGIAVGAIATVGIAAAYIVYKRRKVNSGDDDHRLSGAVGKRRLEFAAKLRQKFSKNTAPSDDGLATPFTRI